MHNKCKGVLPSALGVEKFVSIHFMNILNNFKDGNLIRKCWIPHFL